jgi:hypothetical protein
VPCAGTATLPHTTNRTAAQCCMQCAHCAHTTVLTAKHCHTEAYTLSHTSSCAHYCHTLRCTLPHCRTAAHCRAHCHTLCAVCAVCAVCRLPCAVCAVFFVCVLGKKGSKKFEDSSFGMVYVSVGNYILIQHLAEFGVRLLLIKIARNVPS